LQPDIRVQQSALDPAEETRAMTVGRTDIGALVAFTGICRDEDGKLAALELEHYPGMAEEEIGRIARRATDRWPLLGLRVVHRSGLVHPGDAIVLVLAASAHRGPAFEAASFMMDYLKTHAPFWKREHRADGSEGEWVAASDLDKAAAENWETVMERDISKR
jgi:molybdopterin synthase catalytic subunit